MNINDNRDLRKAIDNLTRWSNENRLPLNIEKTFHVSYVRKSDTSRPHIYYSEMKQIKTVDEVRDLGEIFNKHLKFQSHMDKALATANRLTAMSIRFAKEINHSMIAFVIYNIYIAPILLYAGIIWDQDVSRISE